MSTDVSVVEAATQESWRCVFLPSGARCSDGLNGWLSGDYNETSNGSAMLRYALASPSETRTNRRKASIESSVTATLLEGPSPGDLTKHIGFLQPQETTGTVSQSNPNPFTQNPAKPLANLTEKHRSKDLHGPQRENTQSIPPSGSPHWNTNGELAGVLLKLRAQSAPGSPQTGGGVITRGRVPVESASPPTRKQSQSPTRPPQFIEPNLNAKSIRSAVSATSSSKKSPGKFKSAIIVPLRPEDEKIPYFLRLASLQKENTSDVTHISPSFITQTTVEHSETQDSNSQRSDRYNPLPLTVEPTPPIARGGGLEISQTSTEGSQSSRGRSPPPGQGGVLVPSSAPSTRSYRRSSPSADGFDLDITQTLDLGGNPSRPFSEFDPTQPTQILSDGDVDPDAPTQVLPSQPILRPYGDPRSRALGHTALVLGLPGAIPLRKRPPTRISNKDTGTQEYIRKPSPTQGSSFHLPGLEPTPPAFEPPHTVAEPSTPPSFPVILPDLSPGIVPDSEDGRRAQSLDLNSDTEGEEVLPLKHKGYFPYVQTQDQVRCHAYERHADSFRVMQDDDASVRVQASGQGTLPPTQPLMESPHDLDAWPHETSNTVDLPEPRSQQNCKIKDRAQTFPARKTTRVVKGREDETSGEPEDESDDDYYVKPSDPRRIPMTRSGKKRAPRSQGTGTSPKRKRTVSKAEIPPIGPPVRRNTRQAQAKSVFATHGSSQSVDETSGILVMYKSGTKFFAGWAVPLSASKWIVRPCDGNSSCGINFSQVYRCEFEVGDEIDVLPDKTKRRESFGLATIVSTSDLSTKLWVRVKFRPKDAPDIVLDISLAEVSLQGKPVKDNPRWKARLLKKGDLKQIPCRPVIFPLPVTPGKITPPPPTPVLATTNTRTTSIAPGSKWLDGVGIIFTNLKSPGIDRYKEIVQKHGGEVLQSWLSCFSFKGEIDETRTKWTSKNTDVVKWVGDRRAKTKNIKTMFVITGPPSHTPKLLIAMALGVPCIAPLWLDDCESAVRIMSYPETSINCLLRGAVSIGCRTRPQVLSLITPS